MSDIENEGVMSDNKNEGKILESTQNTTILSENDNLNSQPVVATTPPEIKPTDNDPVDNSADTSTMVKAELNFYKDKDDNTVKPEVITINGINAATFLNGEEYKNIVKVLNKSSNSSAVENTTADLQNNDTKSILEMPDPPIKGGNGIKTKKKRYNKNTTKKHVRKNLYKHNSRKKIRKYINTNNR